VYKQNMCDELAITLLCLHNTFSKY